MISALTIMEEQEGAVEIIRTAAKTAGIISDAVLFARDIVSAPANEMTPTELANEAMESARERNIKCTILEEERDPETRDECPARCRRRER